MGGTHPCFRASLPMRSIDQGGTTVHWDDHATWELTSRLFQKQLVVVHKEQFKSAPYSDSNPLPGIMKCLTNSMPFFPPPSKARAPTVSKKSNRAVAKLQCAVTPVIAERRSTLMQAMNDLHLVLHSEGCESIRQGWEWTFVRMGIGTTILAMGRCNWL